MCCSVLQPCCKTHLCDCSGPWPVTSARGCCDYPRPAGRAHQAGAQPQLLGHLAPFPALLARRLPVPPGRVLLPLAPPPPAAPQASRCPHPRWRQQRLPLAGHLLLRRLPIGSHGAVRPAREWGGGWAGACRLKAGVCKFCVRAPRRGGGAGRSRRRRSALSQRQPGPAPPGLLSPLAMESGGDGRRGPAGREEPLLQQLQPPGEAAEEGEALLPPEAETDWSFVDGEMEAVALRDLPTATIACNLDPRVFQDGPCRVSAAGRPAPRRGMAGRAAGRLPLPASCRLSARLASVRRGRRRLRLLVWGAAACCGGGRCGRRRAAVGGLRGGGRLASARVSKGALVSVAVPLPQEAGNGGAETVALRLVRLSWREASVGKRGGSAPAGRPSAGTVS